MNKETISQLNKVLEQYDYYTQNLSLAELKSIVDISSDQIDLEAIDSKVKILHKTQFSSKISELFFAKCKKSCWREIDEGCYDSVFWPRSKSDIDIIHANFNIPLNEVVLYMRDTSFWNNKNQGLVVTDKAIYVLPNNDNPNEIDSLPWEDISKVQYQNKYLYFYSENNDIQEECPTLHISLFVKKYQDPRTYNGESTTMNDKLYDIGNFIAELFTEIACKVEKKDNYVDVINQVNQLIEEEKYTEALSICKDSFNRFPNNALINNLLLGKVYVRLEQWSNAINVLKEAECLSIQTENYLLDEIRKLLCVASYNIEDWNSSRKNALYVIQHGDKEMFEIEGNSMTNDVQIAKEKFQMAESCFLQHFLESPYRERKILYITDQYRDLYQKDMIVMTSESANKIISFPLGHPINHMLYVGHPLIPCKYIPYQDYQLQFMEDQVREFCLLVQALGAKTIEVSSDTDSLQSSAKKDHKTVDVNMKLISVGGDIEYQSTQSQDLLEKISQSISLNQKFHPHMAIIKPDDFIWWNQMPSWQRLVKQRKNGMLLFYEEKFQTQNNKIVNASELEQINIGVNVLRAEAHLDTKNEATEYCEEQHSKSIVIKVEFASLQELEEASLESNKNLTNLSILEQKFLEDVKFCLEDNHSISDTDRKYLERKCVKLGISLERAEEIIQMCTPSLSTEEQEYLDTLHELTENPQDISPKLRKILDREAEVLGILEQRKIELEKL